MGTLINRVLRTTGLAAILSAIVVGSPNMAMASADRISQGEAQAVLNAGPSGISAILAKANDRAMGAPGNQEVAIRPYFDSGLHYCAEDWHVIALIGFDFNSTHQEAAASFENLTMTFKLDGVTVPTKRTSMHAVSQPEILDADNAWFVQQGRVLAPTDLSVGSHTLSVIVTNAEIPDDNETFETEFVVDAAGTGVCI
jgi:hypothetical protein